MSVEGVAMMTLWRERGLEQFRPLGERRGQELVTGQEQHRELGAALELRPVALGGELAHARLDLLRMALERHAALLLAGGLERGEVGVERRLGVDHQVARFGHVHDQVRAQRAFLADHLQLLGEVAVLAQAGELHQAAQRQLAPAAAHLRAAQRRDQVARLALQLRLAAGERLDLRAQAGEGLAALALERLHLRLGALRARCAAARPAARWPASRSLSAPCGDRLVAPERLAREAQEQLAVAAQRLAGERIERGAQAGLGLLEQVQAVGVLQRARLQAGLRGGQLDRSASMRRAARSCVNSAPSTAPVSECGDGEHAR